jgi:hypothetical protein
MSRHRCGADYRCLERRYIDRIEALSGSAAAAPDERKQATKMGSSRPEERSPRERSRNAATLSMEQESRNKRGHVPPEAVHRPRPAVLGGSIRRRGPENARCPYGSKGSVLKRTSGPFISKPAADPERGASSPQRRAKKGHSRAASRRRRGRRPVALNRKL